MKRKEPGRGGKARILLTACTAAIFGLIVGMGPYAVSAAWAQSSGAATAAAGASGETMFTAGDLNSLVGPIALFPDELLGLVLTASTEPLQIVQAQRFLGRRKAKPEIKPNENWHTSIIGLLNYPEIIELMGNDLEWTEQVGLAYVYQKADVMDAVQQFRARAQVAGNLKSNDKMVIVQEKEVIKIVPAEPEVIYVPSYDPQTIVVASPAPTTVVYSNPYPPYYAPAATFFTGMFVGAAISYGFDWHHHDSYIGGYGHGYGNEINIGGDVNIGNRTVNRERNIDRDKVGVNRGKRNAERDRRSASALSDRRRVRENRPTRSQEGLGRGQRGGRGANAGLAPAGRNRASGARDARTSKQFRSPSGGRPPSGSRNALGVYGRGQDAINNGRRGSESRRQRNFTGSGRDFGGGRRTGATGSRRGGASFGGAPSRRSSSFGGYGSRSRAQRSSSRGGRSSRAQRSGGRGGGGRGGRGGGGRRRR